MSRELLNRELEPIIRTIDRRSETKPGRVVVAVEKKTGKAITDTGFLASLKTLVQEVILNDVALYEITVDEPHWIDNARAAIAVFLTNERSELVFRMRVTAPSSKAAAIAAALHHPELTPAQVLFKTIRTHLGKLLDDSSTQGPESVIERIAANRPAWEAEIVRLINTKLHLEAHIIFELQRPIIDTDVVVRADKIQVNPKDAPHTLFPVTVSVVFERTLSRASDQLPRSEEERQRLVRDVVSKTFRDRIPLFSYWFQPDVLNNELAMALGDALLRYAYGLKAITLDPIEPPVSAEEQIVDQVPWTGRLAREIPFHIESKVRMMASGAGIYHGRKLPNRKQWIKTEVPEALRSAMHGRDFIDLTAEAEREVHNTVHQRLNESARAIGHEVDTFVASAAIPEKKWLEAVTVEVPRREYKTKNDLVPAEFEIGLVVQMTTLARLEQIIQQHGATRTNDPDDGANRAIRNAIVESATRAAERVMSQIEPAKYFSQYEQWEFVEGTDEKQNYVKNQLVRAIQTELKTVFHITSCEVNPRRVDSRVAHIIKLIQQTGDIEVQIKVEPQNSSGPHEALDVTLVYYIGDVMPDQWANVIQRGETTLTKSRLTADLSSWSREALRQRTLKELYGLDARNTENLLIRLDIEKFVSDQVARHYGAAVGIKTINWTYTEIDKLERDYRSLSVEHERARLDRFRAGLKDYSQEEDDSERRTQLRVRLKTLRALINDNERQTGDDFEKLQQHEEELARIEGTLAAANRTTVAGPLQRLAAPAEKPKSSHDSPEGTDSQVIEQETPTPNRDTSL